MHDILQGIEVFIIFVGLSTPLIVIGALIYLKMRFEHKQVMAAIEKGTSLSEVKPPKHTGPAWIKSFTAGIALIIISLPFLVRFLEPLICRNYLSDQSLIAFAVLFGIGCGLFIRGLLQRNARRQIQISNQNGGSQTQSSASACDAESLAQTDK